MGPLTFLLDLFLHLDTHLAEAILHYGIWTYALLFVIVYCETGLVVTPFLPGDSLLFAAGSLAALGDLRFWPLGGLLMAAAFLGDVTNYSAGRFIGARIFRPGARILKPEHLQRTQLFYQRHGSKTVILARFVPIIRTFAPFVAGIGRMRYARFLSFSIVASLLWVSICVGSGYLFGNIPTVKKHFSLVVLGIIAVSLLPMAIGAWRAKQPQKPERK
jgi:membrane-associated protein